MVPLFIILSFFCVVTLLIPNLISLEFNTSYLIMFEGGHCHCQQALSQTASSALCLCFLDSRWSKAAGGVTSCQPDLQYWFWATRLQRSSSHSVTFYKCPTFSGTFCSGWLMFIFFFALQLLYRARVCVVFDQKYSHHLFMSKWRAPSVDNWRDLSLICTCVCDFIFFPNIYRPEPVQRNSGK